MAPWYEGILGTPSLGMFLPSCEDVIHWAIGPRETLGAQMLNVLSMMIPQDLQHKTEALHNNIMISWWCRERFLGMTGSNAWSCHGIHFHSTIEVGGDFRRENERKSTVFTAPTMIHPPKFLC